MSDTVTVSPYPLEGLGSFEKSFFNNHARTQDAARLASRGTGAPPTTPDPGGLLRHLRRSAGVQRFLPQAMDGLGAEDMTPAEPSGDIFSNEGQAALERTAAKAASDAQIAQAVVAPNVQAAGAARAAGSWPLARHYLATATAAQVQANRASTVAVNVMQAVGLARWARRQVVQGAPAAAAKTYGVAADKLATAKAVAESTIVTNVADTGEAAAKQAAMDASAQAPETVALATPVMTPPERNVPPDWGVPYGSMQNGPETMLQGYDDPEEIAATLYGAPGLRGFRGLGGRGLGGRGLGDAWDLLNTVVEAGGKVAATVLQKAPVAPGQPGYVAPTPTYLPQPVAAASSLPTILAIVAGVAVLGGAAYFVMKD